MKTASSFLQILALGACFATHADVTDEHVAGVRRALQTMEAPAGTNPRFGDKAGIASVALAA
ncbi:hypothetical protein [Chelativorans sp. AA-79]|uniref:hypothetical protein n=1 Tax=Chelativorans sp. AA-79 TaxID=3028735 RepID=UPI0023F83325|nr:hypothetical protein [Chelativorans sp. AA-79]WEX12084.1 hypothetical protein PVE73_26650 [Chelativorans sp. AA-79]